jgi:hypothetical protein
MLLPELSILSFDTYLLAKAHLWAFNRIGSTIRLYETHSAQIPFNIFFFFSRSGRTSDNLGSKLVYFAEHHSNNSYFKINTDCELAAFDGPICPITSYSSLYLTTSGALIACPKQPG